MKSRRVPSPNDPSAAREAAVPGDVTQLLAAARGGQRDALDRLLPLLYDELRDLAGRQMRRERPDHTLHSTALVHEVYVKLAAGGAPEASDRAHFLAIAARAMRQVLVDHARRRMAAKRGGSWAVTTLSDGHQAVEFRPEEMLALDRALEGLESRQRQVVEYRYFAGMEEAEIAEVLDISERTVRRDWVKARAWLYRELYPDLG
jgi:RNA polymerase sigma factor (TIGR02999 family)